MSNKNYDNPLRQICMNAMSIFGHLAIFMTHLICYCTFNDVIGQSVCRCRYSSTMLNYKNIQIRLNSYTFLF